MKEDDKNDFKTENSKNEINFEHEIDQFIKHLEAQADIVPLIMNLLGIKRIQESKHVEKYIKESDIVEEKEGDTIKLHIPPHQIKKFIDLNETVETSNIAYKLLPINFVVSFVSQYDAYLGGIIRVMFNEKPELLNSLEKNISFSELIKFKSIEEAQEFIIEKEVESVLRESHIKQFKWIESKLNMTLRKDLPSFNDFVEITERRNLFVHCNGVVSRQYIEVCKQNNVSNINEIQLGSKLDVSPDYLTHCYSILFEIGIKLGQVIWRKLKPDEIKDADSHLNNVCFQLLIKNQYNLALRLLTFATDTLKKHYDQEIVCILTINKALAYYLSDKKKECLKVIEVQDWSATNDKFKLAIDVLRENFDNAVVLMKSIGNNNEHITKEAYREWPLFREFRKRQDFKDAYKEIFDEEFVYIEAKPKDLEDILNEMKQLKKNKSRNNEKAVAMKKLDHSNKTKPV